MWWQRLGFGGLPSGGFGDRRFGEIFGGEPGRRNKANPRGAPDQRACVIAALAKTKPIATGCNRMQPGATGCNRVQPGATSRPGGGVRDRENKANSLVARSDETSRTHSYELRQLARRKPGLALFHTDSALLGREPAARNHCGATVENRASFRVILTPPAATVCSGKIA